MVFKMQGRYCLLHVCSNRWEYTLALALKEMKATIMILLDVWKVCSKEFLFPY